MVEHNFKIRIENMKATLLHMHIFSVLHLATKLGPIIFIVWQLWAYIEQSEPFSKHVVYQYFHFLVLIFHKFKKLS